MRTSGTAIFCRAWESWSLFENMGNFKKGLVWLEWLNLKPHYARPQMAGMPVILWLPKANRLLYLISVQWCHNSSRAMQLFLVFRFHQWSSNSEYSDYIDIYLSFSFLSNSLAIELAHKNKTKQWSNELKACDLFMSLKLSRELGQGG